MEQPTVLVVDDDSAIRMLLRQALEMGRYRVEAGATLPEALAALRQRNIDVILTDIVDAGVIGPNLDFLVSLSGASANLTI